MKKKSTVRGPSKKVHEHSGYQVLEIHKIRFNSLQEFYPFESLQGRRLIRDHDQNTCHDKVVKGLCLFHCKNARCT